MGTLRVLAACSSGLCPELFALHHYVRASLRGVICAGCPGSSLHTYDLIISAESMEEQLVMVKTWILSEMENKLAYMCKHGD